jgi:hypothetical protein
MKEFLFPKSEPSLLRERLHRLDDRSALALLARQTVEVAGREGVETEASEEILWPLVDVFGFPDDGPPPSDGDLARTALSALAEDPPVAQALESAIASPLENAGEHLPVMTGALLALQHYARFSRKSEIPSVFIPTERPSQFSALQELTHVLLLRAEADQPGLIARFRQRSHAILRQLRAERL